MTHELPQQTRPLLAAALEYAARGWAIVPVVGTKPAVPIPAYAPPEAELRRWFAPGSAATGLAVVLGLHAGARVACIRFANDARLHAWISTTLRYHSIAAPPAVIAPDGQAVALFHTPIEAPAAPIVPQTDHSKQASDSALLWGQTAPKMYGVRAVPPVAHVEPAPPPRGFVILPPSTVDGGAYRWWRPLHAPPLIEPRTIGLDPRTLYS